MKWLVVMFPAVLLLAACGLPGNEVISFKDGVMRATTPNEAADYCHAKGSSAHMVGKAPAETGVLFRCD